jgi:hypothetical protein
MLYTPILIVLLSTPRARLVPGLLLLIAATSAFCLQHQAGLLIRRRAQASVAWLGGFLCLLLASGLPLLFAGHRRELLLIALLAAGMFGIKAILLLTVRRRFDRTFGGELLGVLALTLTGPAAYVVSRGALDGMAWCLWGGVVLYFTSGVFMVNLLLAAARSKAPLNARARWRLGRGHVAYHVLLALLMGYISATMSRLGALLFVLACAPFLTRAFAGWMTLSNQLPCLKRVGLAELLYTVWFAGFSTAWLHLS